MKGTAMKTAMIIAMLAIGCGHAKKIINRTPETGSYRRMEMIYICSDGRFFYSKYISCNDPKYQGAAYVALGRGYKDPGMTEAEWLKDLQKTQAETEQENKQILNDFVDQYGPEVLFVNP